MSAAAPAAADAARPASTAEVGARGVEGEAASGEMREAPPAPARAGAAAEDAAPGEAEAEAEAEAAEQTAASSSSNKGAAELRTPAFALARVGKIIKADADIDTLPKESLRAIALASEMIIATMASHSAVHAQLDKRKYVQYSDISYAVRKNDLFFLHSIIPAALPLPVAMRRREKYIQKLRDAQSGDGDAAALLEQIKQIPIWHGGEVEGEGEMEPWE